MRIIIACAAVLVLGGGIAAGLALGSDKGAVSGHKVAVVAAENVYGNMAAQIGGSHVSVTSILTNPNSDPHLFEPGTATGYAVAHAQLIVQNGLGYDSFMSKLESAAPNALRRVVTMADVLHIHGSSANPHLWYDVPHLAGIAGAITAGLVRADQDHAASYRQGLRRFEASLAPLRRTVAGIRSRFAGKPVAYTEPVPGYLVSAAGLMNLAPSAFTRAIEEGREPSPQAFSTMRSLVGGPKIRVLLYNSQAVSPITRQLQQQARRATVPVVPVTETLPPGLSFQQWQLGQARALETALAR